MVVFVSRSGPDTGDCECIYLTPRGQPTIASLQSPQMSLSLAASSNTGQDKPSSLVAVGPANTESKTHATATAAPRLLLNPRESVLTVSWQCIPSSFGSKAVSASADMKSNQRIWLTSSSGPLLGVLTDQRVLLLTSTLDIVNSFVYSSSTSSRPAKTRMEHSQRVEITSLSWIGCALIFSNDLGQIFYLLPISRLTQLITSRTAIRDSFGITLTKLRTCGLVDDDFGVGVLATVSTEVLPRNSPVRSRGSVSAPCIHIIACLPDRLVFSNLIWSNIDDANGERSLVVRTRPLVPCEPLIFGLLITELSMNAILANISAWMNPSDWLNNVSNSSPTTVTEKVRYQTIAQIVTQYYVPRDIKTTKVPWISSHSSIKLILALNFVGYHELACIIAGIPYKAPDAVLTNGGYSTGEMFPRNRWIPSGLKFDITVSAAATCNQSTGDSKANKLSSDLTSILPLTESSAARSGFLNKLSETSVHKSKTSDTDSQRDKGSRLVYDEMSAALALVYGNMQSNVFDRIIDPSSLSGGLLPHWTSPFMTQLHSASHILTSISTKPFSASNLRSHESRSEVKVGNDSSHAKKASKKQESKKSDNKLIESEAIQRIVDIYSTKNTSFSSKTGSIIDFDDLYSNKLHSPTFDRAILTPENVNSDELKPSERLSILNDIIKQHQLGSSSTFHSIGVVPGSSNSNWQLGPRPTLPLLSGEVLEDWLGLKSLPEGVTSTVSHMNRDGNSSQSAVSSMATKIALKGSGTGNSLSAGITDGSVLLPMSLTSVPDTWVSDVGHGHSSQGTAREQEKLVGYWRFSDVVLPGERGFCNSCVLGKDRCATKLVFSDLSKYSGINYLELYLPVVVSTEPEEMNSSRRIIVIEASVSSVDPGEDHEKIKSLSDVVATNSDDASSNSDSAAAYGLYVMIGRGGPLDVGLYHIDPDRCKLTIEMMLYCGRLSSHDRWTDLTTSILQRRVCKSTSSKESSSRANFIYELAVDKKNGALIFVLGESNEKERYQSSNPLILRSDPGALFDATSDEVAMNWQHVVLSLSSQSNQNVYSTSAGWTTSVNVVVYVNGNACIQGISSTVGDPSKTFLKPLLEQDLALTYLCITPGLPQAWRVTEVRSWSDLRSSTELDDSRDNYLNFASKRKRQQLRQKGTKEMFTALRAAWDVDTSVRPIANVSENVLIFPNLSASALLEPTTAVAGTNASTQSLGVKSEIVLTSPMLKSPGGDRGNTRLDQPTSSAVDSSNRETDSRVDCDPANEAITTDIAATKTRALGGGLLSAPLATAGAARLTRTRSTRIKSNTDSTNSQHE